MYRVVTNGIDFKVQEKEILVLEYPPEGRGVRWKDLQHFSTKEGAKKYIGYLNHPWEVVE